MEQLETVQRIPLSLIRHQKPMLAALGRIAVRAAIPITRPSANPQRFVDEHKVIEAPANELVDRYAAWSGASGAYPQALPPHMISQWSIALATTALRQTRYNLATIVNQGVSLRINGDLPRGVPLHLGARISHLEESDERARVSVSLTTGTAIDPTIIEAVLEATFPLSRASRSRRKHLDDEKEWTTTSTWQAAKDDGLKFAILTGDFNPIHWLAIAGRVSPFGSTVMQGFGTLARTFEALNRHTPIDFIDVRFLRPVPLPSPPLSVQVHTAAPTPRVRLIGPDARLHLAGTYSRRLP